MTEQNGFQDALKVLHDDYAANLPIKLDHIEQVWQHLTRDTWDEESFQSLHRMVHSLSGSGTTFGFASLSHAARQLEEALQPFILAKALPGEEQLEQVQALLDELLNVWLRELLDTQPDLLS